MMPAQQMKRMTFGNAALSVRMRIWKWADHIRLNQKAMTKKKKTTVASSGGGLDLRCTSWSSPCSGRRRSTPAWFLFRGRCCRCRSSWRPNGSGRSRSMGRRRGRRGGRSGRRLPCSGSLFSGWSRWCSACRWRWWGCTSRSQTPACRTRGRLSRCSSCSTGCTPGYGTRSVSWVLPPLVNLIAEFEPLLDLYPLSCCFGLEVTADVCTCAFCFCHPNHIIINIWIGSLTDCRRIPVRTERVQRMKEAMQVRMMTQSNTSVR